MQTSHHCNGERHFLFFKEKRSNAITPFPVEVGCLFTTTLQPHATSLSDLSTLKCKGSSFLIKREEEQGDHFNKRQWFPQKGHVFGIWSILDFLAMRQPSTIFFRSALKVCLHTNCLPVRVCSLLTFFFRIMNIYTPASPPKKTPLDWIKMANKF